MATKIFYSDNRIIIDGHADTEQECRAITAMCDEMANSENFKTIVYEEGHAVFEQVSGGESEMFLQGIQQCKCNLDEYLKSAEAKGIYLTQTDAASIYATKTLLNDAINELQSAIGSVDPSTSGSIAQQIGTINASILQLQNAVTALENKESETLPYTADELVALLVKLENL